MSGRGGRGRCAAAAENGPSDGLASGAGLCRGRDPGCRRLREECCERPREGVKSGRGAGDGSNPHSRAAATPAPQRGSVQPESMRRGVPAAAATPRLTPASHRFFCVFVCDPRGSARGRIGKCGRHSKCHTRPAPTPEAWTERASSATRDPDAAEQRNSTTRGLPGGGHAAEPFAAANATQYRTGSDPNLVRASLSFAVRRSRRPELRPGPQSDGRPPGRQAWSFGQER